MAEIYQYNEIKLPALPEWDTTAYPYAMICEYSAMPVLDGTVTSIKGYSLVVSADPMRVYFYTGTDLTDRSIVFHAITGYFREALCYTNINGVDIDTADYVWKDFDSEKNSPAAYWFNIEWSNYNVELCDGSTNLLGEIGFYASEPVPVGGAEWQKHDAYKPNTKWDGHTFYKVIGNKWVKHDAVVPAE